MYVLCRHMCVKTMHDCVQLLASFDRIDSNHDGCIDRKEWRRRGGDDSSFDRADRDHDGKIDRDAMDATARLLRALPHDWSGVEVDFNPADLNHDGSLPLKEWKRRRHDDSSFDRRSKIDRHRMDFYDTDSNHDGSIAREEWRRSGRDKNSFDCADFDYNGKIDHDEMYLSPHR